MRPARRGAATSSAASSAAATVSPSSRSPTCAWPSTICYRRVGPRHAPENPRRQLALCATRHAGLRLELAHARLELDDAPGALLTLEQPAASLLLELVRHRARVARRAPLATARDRGDRPGDGERQRQPHDGPEGETPAPLELREPLSLVGLQPDAALQVRELLLDLGGARLGGDQALLQLAAGGLVAGLDRGLGAVEAQH